MFHSSPDTSVDVETVQTLDRGAFSSTDIPKGLKKYPDSSSTSPETIVELEKQTSEIRTSYRTVSVAIRVRGQTAGTQRKSQKSSIEVVRLAPVSFSRY